MRTGHRDRSGTKTENRKGKPREKSVRTSDEWLYGRNAVLESLRAERRTFRQLLLLGNAGNDPRLDEIDHRARQLGISIESVDRAALDQFVPHVNHQGVAALATPFPYTEPDTLDHREGSMLALDHLHDPQNVGTLLRTAEAFGVETILIPKDRAAGITPAAVNASAGAVEHLAIVRTVNLTHELDRLKKRGLWVVGIEHHESAQPLGSIPIPTPCVIVIGSEGQGMGPNLIKRCDLVLQIEMVGHVNSLNAATAGSIALYELSRS